jgi:signal transduction histidine kinase
VAASGPGERAIALPGLLPDAASLSALVDDRGTVPWSTVRSDPGLLFFLLTRHIPFTADADPVLGDRDLCAALALLEERNAAWADWSSPSIRPVVRSALAAAHFAMLLAESTEAVDPARAWAGGWLAFAGWLAIGVAAPEAITACGTDTAFSGDPFGTQVRHWDMRRAEVAWRLAANWPLPRWASVTLGRVDAAPADVVEGGGDRRLHAIMQVAVLLAEQSETRLYVADEFDLAAALVELSLRSADLNVIRSRYAAEVNLEEWFDRSWIDPRTMTGLRERIVGQVSQPVLRYASENVAAESCEVLGDGSGGTRSVGEGAAAPPVAAVALAHASGSGELPPQNVIPNSGRVLSSITDTGNLLGVMAPNRRDLPNATSESKRPVGQVGKPVLRDADQDTTELVDLYSEQIEVAKLSAVAELAAGASHEINNPLAVISGQSQYLLKQESDEKRREALRSIVRQTQRIHSVLAELMLFARPPEPRPEWLDFGRLVREASVDLVPLAAERRVDVQMGHYAASLWVEVDPKQMRIALAALVRNGIEAAPAGGWVRMTMTLRPDRVEVAVDDNGPGPDERSREHLFDPFYSGRAAGRGRGLGLPAAWRLARENGGEVRYVPVPGGPTRFVLSLPAAAVAAGAQRKSA